MSVEKSPPFALSPARKILSSFIDKGCVVFRTSRNILHIVLKLKSYEDCCWAEVPFTRNLAALIDYELESTHNKHLA